MTSSVNWSSWPPNRDSTVKTPRQAGEPLYTAVALPVALPVGMPDDLPPIVVPGGGPGSLRATPDMTGPRRDRAGRSCGCLERKPGPVPLALEPPRSAAKPGGSPESQPGGLTNQRPSVYFPEHNILWMVWYRVFHDVVWRVVDMTFRTRHRPVLGRPFRSRRLFAAAGSTAADPGDRPP